MGLDILIDGFFTDWERRISQAVTVFDDSDDGFDAAGSFIGSELSDYADIEKVMLYSDTDFFYGLIDTYSAGDSKDFSWSLFLDIDDNPSTGYAANWGSIGAEYLFLNGILHSWSGKSSGDWSWEPINDSCIALSQGIQTQHLPEFAIPRPRINWITNNPIKLYFQMNDVRGTGWEDDYMDNLPEFGEGGILFP